LPACVKITKALTLAKLNELIGEARELITALCDSGHPDKELLDGKSKAARRILPMIPDVYQALKARYEQQGRPTEGWVFPSTARCGHLEQGTAKTQHAAALAKANAEAIRNNLPLPLKRFEPYVMRHTALTRMAPHCDPFTLAKIAGHSSITITRSG
jgi:integrase